MKFIFINYLDKPFCELDEGTENRDITSFFDYKNCKRWFVPGQTLKGWVLDLPAITLRDKIHN